MPQVKVLITKRLPRKYREMIATFDPRLEVSYLPERIADFRNIIFPPLEREPTPQEMDAVLQGAEVILGRIPPGLPHRALKLRWVQLATGGFTTAGSASWPEGVTVTTAAGVHAVPIAEYVMTMALMLVRDVTRIMTAKERRHWDHFVAGELRGKTLGLVGLGHIGREVAGLARAFGMRVLATRRSARKKDYAVNGVDMLYPPQGLHEMLGLSDFLILCLPLTAESRRMIGERELRAMKLSSYLINVSRGEIVDEEALVRALQEGWIAGAALDVFEKEPLPQESPLWGMPNVIISAHLSGVTHRYNQRMTQLFCENLRRYLSGEPLLNTVERERGY